MAMTISGTSGVTFPDSTSMATGQQACKAWVNFNGTGPAIRASYNVSSVTNTASGEYLISFTTSMSDTNYCFVATGQASVAAGTVTNGTKTTSQLKVGFLVYNVGGFTPPDGNVAVFR